MTNFEIEGLDHVAIRVVDFDTSIKWYETVLGLKKYKVKKWGDFPVFFIVWQSWYCIIPCKY